MVHKQRGLKAKLKSGKIFTGKVAKILVRAGIAKETRERKATDGEEKPVKPVSSVGGKQSRKKAER